MNLKQDSKTIDGITVKTQQLPAMRAFTLFARLMKLVGPALGALMKLDPNTQLDFASAGLTDAFAALDPNEAARLLPEIFSSTSASLPDDPNKHVSLANDSNINNVFSGNLPALFAAIGFVLQVNYRDFGFGSALSAPQPLAVPVA